MSTSRGLLVFLALVGALVALTASAIGVILPGVQPVLIGLSYVGLGFFLVCGLVVITTRRGS